MEQLRTRELKYFTNYVHKHGNFDAMMAWLEDALKKLLTQIGNVLLYNTLSGLRFSENLLASDLYKQTWMKQQVQYINSYNCYSGSARVG
jgi:hypothetical protein